MLNEYKKVISHSSPWSKLQVPGCPLCFVEYWKAKRPYSQRNSLGSLDNRGYKFREEGNVTAVTVSNQRSVVLNIGVHVELGRLPERL